jgi:hypothetical protein
MSSYALRLPESLKQAPKRIAAADDTTMNQFFVVAITEKISAMETASFFERRATLGSPDTAQAAWDKVGDKGALTDDQWTK